LCTFKRVRLLPPGTGKRRGHYKKGVPNIKKGKKRGWIPLMGGKEKNCLGLNGGKEVVASIKQQERTMGGSRRNFLKIS